MSKEVSLKQVAKELNDVMMYGMEDGKLVDAEEQIDVSLKEKALLAVIKEKAARDLRWSDEEDFSAEVWEWFIDNGIEPTGDEEEEEEEAPAKKPSKLAKKAEPEEDEEPEEAPTKKSSKKADKPAKKAPPKRSSGPSFEQVAIDCVKDGGTKKDLTKLFVKLYQERGKDDPDFIAKRVDIYYNIALKATGTKPDKKEKETKVAEKPAKKEDKKAVKKAEPEEEEEEAPAKKPVKKLRK